MFHRLHSRMRTLLAMCCMALTALLTAQGAVAGVDRAQHAVGIDHAPTPMAGAVHYDHDDHQHDHDDTPDHNGSGTPDDDGARPSHHHYAEGPQIPTPDVGRLPELILARVASPSGLAVTGLPLLVTSRLERPPRSSSKTDA